MSAAALLLACLCPGEETEAVEFSRDVRPILSQNCFPCHGPDEHARKSDLRLDLPSAQSDPRLVAPPGEDGPSELLRRIGATSPEVRMPPPEARRELSAEELDVLRRWIEAGAEYEDHWSFRPVRTPVLPVVERAGWPRNPIDRFVIAALDAQGLSPAPEADRRTLIRRLSLDLCGLPPTPEEVRAFETDTRPDAYERLVERLLESSAHAERMALAWMDAARYGDTSVYHADGPRSMWPWRDWVIGAYAENMPFDRFTAEQLAGDLLPGAGPSGLVAAGFHRNNGTSDEGGAIDEELRVSYMVDRVKTTSNVWLGLSMECAQCHDHKYDPITQEDYYSFFAFFNQSVEKGFQTRNGNEAPLYRVPDLEQERREEELEQRIEVARAELAALEPPGDEVDLWIEAELARLASIEGTRLSEWSSLGPFQAASGQEAFRTSYGPESSPLDGGVIPGEREWRPRPELADGKTHSLAMPNNSAVYLRRTVHAERACAPAVSLGSDDTIQVWLNGEELLAKEVFRGVQADQERVELSLNPGENELLLKICNGGGASGFYCRLLGSPLSSGVQEALVSEAGARKPEQREVLNAHFLREVWEAGVQKVQAIEAVEGELSALVAQSPTVMTMEDRPDGRMTYVLERGQYDAPNEGRPVEPKAPAWIMPMPPLASPDRLGLAMWLTHPEHPLTARVAVNRYWAMLFDRGIVRTVMDFGSQGEWPTHPELLDWLASDFVASGWNVRHVLRQMVLSATYRQSSASTPEHKQLDPENRWLARAPRHRLDGEFLRDQALAVSGLLVDQVGGPGVRPYQPEGLWNEVSLDKNVRFAQDHGSKLYRKSMYIYWKRSAPMPVMTTFDAPTREKCVVQRQRTNTPLQALVLLNDIQFVEAARHLAERMLAAGADFASRLDHGFELCTARPADELRRATLGALLEEQLAVYGAEPQAAAALLAVGESERDEALDPVEHAAWTIVASVLLNLDETLNRE